jgi:sugar/nucleoside kinase (ribokinase family)
MKSMMRRWRRAPTRRARVLVGQVYWEYCLGVHELQPGATQQLLGRTAGPGGRAIRQAIIQRTLAPKSPTLLLASVGTDAEGRALRRSLRQCRIQLPWLPVGDVATSVLYVIGDSEPGKPTTLDGTAPRVPAVPARLLEPALARAEACCLVDPANNDEIPVVLRSAARAQVPVFFSVGPRQVDSLGYEGLGAALEEEVELLLCGPLEAVRLTNCQDVAGQLEGLRFDGQVRTVVITNGARGVQASQDGELFFEPAYSDRRPVVNEAFANDAAQAALVDALLRSQPLTVALRAAARQGFEVSVGHGPTRLRDAEGMGAPLTSGEAALVG